MDVHAVNRPRGQPMHREGVPEFVMSGIRQVGLMLAAGQAGAFAFDIRRIGLA